MVESAMKPKKKLLLFASKMGYQTREFSAAAEQLGVEVLFATDRCHKLDDPWSDGALPLHFERPQAAGEEAALRFRGDPPDALLALGDRPSVAGAFAARALGLRGNSPESVEICHNKLWQREVLSAAKLPVPEFFSFQAEEEIARVLPRVKFPCVVKPLTLAASQGVIRANDWEEFKRAVLRIRRLMTSAELRAAHDPSLGQLLVERYIPGKEVAIEGLLERGRLRILAIFDKPDPLEGPYFEETIYVTPSRLALSQQEALRDCAQKAVAALGLNTGPIHAEFRIDEDVPWILEVAPRPIGGLCSHSLLFGSAKMSLEELLIRHALELGGSDVEREKTASGVMMIPVPRSGIFERVEGIAEAEKVSCVYEIQITARVRDYIAAWPEGSSYLGFIFAKSDSPEVVEAALREAHGKLRFTFSTRLAVEHPATRTMPVEGSD